MRKSVPGSDAKTEIWLPTENWNHEYQPAGGGFYGAGMAYARMREILRGGSATSGSDSGMDGGLSALIQRPEQMKNIANGPSHAMIEQGKALIAAYYGVAPQSTLMDECGNGGSRDAMAIVQRWPGDLDVATAIGATDYGTHHGIAQMWLYWATHKDEARYIPEEKYPVIHQAALDACDAKDGVKDGVIEDPPHCKFDPGVLHAALYGPMVPGSEFSWPDMVARPRPYPYAEQFYRFFVFHDPNWDYKTFTPDFAADVDRADARENLPMNATDPDIAPFIDRGGKLIMMGGWNDDLGPGNNVNYYQSVVRTIGAAKARKGIRLFMVPGMHHCLGGEFPTIYKVDFDLPAAAKQWKQTGKGPDEIVVTTTRKGEPARKRVVCAYPKVSRYKGQGDTNDPANFVCQTP